MNLSSGLPYSAEVYTALMAEYNSQWLAVVILSFTAAAVLFLTVFRRQHLPLRWQRLSGLLLAVMAVWVGLLHQWQMMAALNFMAPFYAAAWFVFALWLILRLVALPPPSPSIDALSRVSAAVVLACALVLYPALQWLSGVDLAALDLPGTGPNGTAMLAAGAIIALAGRSRLDLLIFPVLWSGVAALHGYLLDLPADYVPIAVVVPASLFLAITAGLQKHAPKA